MTRKAIRALLIISSCNPEVASVPLLGYEHFNAVSRLADVTLVTHARNQAALEKVRAGRKIIYIPESVAASSYFRIARRVLAGQPANWFLRHLLYYPVYAEFNRRGYAALKDDVLAGEYDVVHALTSIIARYPYKIVDACRDTPFVLGPVNGGLPFPPAFRRVARKEFAALHRLRRLSYLLPGYVKTYTRADMILAGATFMRDRLRQMFAIDDGRLALFPENGVSGTLFETQAQPPSDGQVRLLFVGRLVPFKGCNFLVEALGRLEPVSRARVLLTIVGSGPEHGYLEDLARQLGVAQAIHFTGWLPQADVKRYYHAADIFCFPSIREFGGAVVLEAMACGLPCIVADYGGVAEYVTEEAGFKIPLKSPEQLKAALAEKIQVLVEDEALRARMAAAARERAREFTWEEKAARLVTLYEQTINGRTAAQR